MKKFNWLVECDSPGITPIEFAKMIGARVQTLYVDVKDGPGWYSIPQVPAKEIKYVLSMTEEDAVAFKIGTVGMSIRKTKW